jgi:hypothetical protein
VRVVADDGSCWIQVRKSGISGQILYQATLPRGQSKTFRTRSAIYVRLGVPAYVSITVDGGSAYKPAETVSTNYEVTRKGVVRF